LTLEFYKSFQPQIPHLPGVYQYWSGEEILYIGKAKDLKNRLNSYFQDSKQLSYKTKRMVFTADKITFTIVETEQDAFLLENTLIKKFQPRFNIMLKDDKTYPYIVIKKEAFPRVYFTRQKEKDGSEYLGPYTNVSKVKILLELVQKLFKIRTCNFNLNEENILKKKFKRCLEYHIGNCKAPCEGLQTEQEYNAQIVSIRHILKGNFSLVAEILKAKIMELAADYKYEEAQIVKENLDFLNQYQSRSTVVNPSISDVEVFGFAYDDTRAYISYMNVMNGSIVRSAITEIQKNAEINNEAILAQSIIQLREKYDSEANEIIVPFEIDLFDNNLKITVPKVGGKMKLLQLSLKNASYHLSLNSQDDDTKLNAKVRVLLELQTALNLPRLPLHIECFDNSNLQGTNPVSSCVVFKEGKPSKKDYRHFDIKSVEGPNDFLTMQEVVERRYKRIIEEEKPLPDLIIIDGGKGQLSSAVAVLIQLNLIDKIPIVGLAKRMEEVFLPSDDVPIYISKKSESLKLIQYIRDEAHRFAITFHRKKRSINFIHSELDNIKGLGEKSKIILLNHFKSIKNIKMASVTDLQQIVGKSKTQIIINYFNSTNLK
jgi:excinuclease ABC subunit C